MITTVLPQVETFANGSIGMAFGAWHVPSILLSDEKSSSFEGGIEFGCNLKSFAQLDKYRCVIKVGHTILT